MMPLFNSTRSGNCGGSARSGEGSGLVNRTSQRLVEIVLAQTSDTNPTDLRLTATRRRKSEGWLLV